MVFLPAQQPLAALGLRGGLFASTTTLSRLGLGGGLFASTTTLSRLRLAGRLFASTTTLSRFGTPRWSFCLHNNP